MKYKNVWFVWVNALRSNQQYFSYIGMFSLVEPVLSSVDKVSSSKTEHSAVPSMRLKPGSFQSQVEHSATEPLLFSEMPEYLGYHIQPYNHPDS